MAKEEMIGLRERVLTHMADLSLMQKPLEREVRGEVIPWLNNKITGYIGDEIGVESVAGLMLNTGIEAAAKDHKDTMRRRREAIAKAKLDAEQAARDNEKRKQDRRAAREKRAKDQKKEAMKQEIRKLFIMHTDASVVSPAVGWRR